MNLEKELNKKQKELENTKNILIENLIISQQKYSKYKDEQRRLEEEIRQLKENLNRPKIIKTWKEVGDGWKQRIYKNE